MGALEKRGEEAVSRVILYTGLWSVSADLIQ